MSFTTCAHLSTETENEVGNEEGSPAEEKTDEDYSEHSSGLVFREKFLKRKDYGLQRRGTDHTGCIRAFPLHSRDDE